MFRAVFLDVVHAHPLVSVGGSDLSGSEAGSELLEDHTSDHPGQMISQADVGADPEGEMGFGRVPIQPEVFCVRIDGIVPIRGGNAQHDLLALVNRAAADRFVRFRLAEQEGDRGLEAKRLVDRRGDQFGLLAEGPLELRIRNPSVEQVAKHEARRKGAGEHVDHEGSGVVPADHPALFVRRLNHGRDQSGRRCFSGFLPLADQSIDARGELGEAELDAFAPFRLPGRRPATVQELVAP